MSWRHSQNFLHSSRLVRALVAGSSIGPSDDIVDIGAGRGILTAALAERCRRVIAIEIDPRLIDRLRRRFADTPSVRVLHADAVTAPLPDRPYKVFANIPFDRTAALMRKLFDGDRPPDDAYLVLQKQAVAKHLGLGRATGVGMARRPWFEGRVLRGLKRSDFSPRPAVDSAWVRLRRRDPPLLDRRCVADFRAFVGFGFARGSVTLRRRFGEVFGRREFARLAADAGFHRDASCGDLTLEHWLWLFRRFDSVTEPSRRGVVLGASGSRPFVCRATRRGVPRRQA